MRQQNYIAPAPNLEAFNCVQCMVFAKQTWFYLQGSSEFNGYGHMFQDLKFTVSRCENCQATTIWRGNTIIHPDEGLAEPPNVDLPDDAKLDYIEASRIVTRSPRGAAALLRLSLQKLCMHLGLPGKNINDDIKSLVSKGLPVAVQQAFDSVRIVGNNAVHPGELDLRDDQETAIKLFRLVNFVVAKMITEPKEIETIYAGLPEGPRNAVGRRDGKHG